MKKQGKVSLNSVHENTLFTKPNSETERMMMLHFNEVEQEESNLSIQSVVNSAVEQLEWEDSTILTLRFYEQKSFAEITAIMQLSSKSVAFNKTKEALKKLEVIIRDQILAE